MDTLYGGMHLCFHTLTITHSVASAYKVDVFYRLQCVIREPNQHASILQWESTQHGQPHCTVFCLYVRRYVHTYTLSARTHTHARTHARTHTHTHTHFVYRVVDC